MVDYSDRLKEAMAERGIDTAELTRAMQRHTRITYQGVKKVVDGLSKSFSAKNNGIAAGILGVRSNWLAGGLGPKAAFSDGRDLHDGSAVYTAHMDDHGRDAQTVQVPLLANSGSMGPGNDELHEDVMLGALHLSTEWLERQVRPTSLGDLRFIHAYGESMAPTFTDGDVLLVDTMARDPGSIDGVYVLRAHDRLYIKRVRRRMDGNLEISSDNPTVKTVDVLDGSQPINVAGRVIWAWNGRKL